ncbi:MAG: FKBP-type peptidyl-prolyl cis-trans isomerase [Candidatus Fibromonas sp.]|jgi:FKBP-type peptidyl-prolyl cis-trans isomerase|nr:FKBP-type peptidyl-prolyl cis-trans isomerase [Candidatus Fibromonas sp.]
MKKSLFTVAALMSVIFMSCDLNANSKEVSTKAALETPKGKHSYAVGIDLGRVVKQQIDAIKAAEAGLDSSLIIQGMKDFLDTTKPVLMNDSEVTAALKDLMMEMHKTSIARDSIRAAENLAKAAENLVSQNAFLEKNKSEVGIVATESGLQYIVITQGSGETAKDGDTVSVHYTGSLLDGTEFDSSIKRDSPLSIVLGDGQLIKGWVEILRLMKKGDKVKAWIPSSLGYGEQGNHVISGNSLLIFEIELLDIKAAKK